MGWLTTLAARAAPTAFTVFDTAAISALWGFLA